LGPPPAPAPYPSLGLRHGGGWVRDFGLRNFKKWLGCRRGRAPWLAGLDNSLAVAVGAGAAADRGWRGEAAVGTAAVAVSSLLSARSADNNFAVGISDAFDLDSAFNIPSQTI
jgi:hypothetical protein